MREAGSSLPLCREPMGWPGGSVVAPVMRALPYVRSAARYTSLLRCWSLLDVAHAREAKRCPFVRSSDLRQMYPFRDRWNAIHVDEEQHVPAGWGDVGLVGDFCADQAGSLGEDVEIHQSLA